MRLHFRKQLTELRTKAGLSQEALAEKLGVSRQTVCNWERGVYYPHKECLQKMCGLFGVKESYYYGDPSSLAEEEVAASSAAAELSMSAEQVPEASRPMASMRKRVAFWLVFGLFAFFVVVVSAILMLAYFPYKQGGDYNLSIAAWNFSYECIVGLIVAGMLLFLALLGCLAWRFIKMYGLKAQKEERCQAKLDKCKAKLGRQTDEDKVQSEEKTR